MNKKIYIPLILVEIYLLFTIWILYFGPIVWPIKNESYFLTLIFLYHISFVFGYLFYLKINSKNKHLLIKESSSKTEGYFERLVLNHFWKLLAISLISIFISHRNITHSSSYIPWDIFTDFYKGLLDPAAARRYYASPEYSNMFLGNTYVTSMLVFISVFKYALLPVFVFLWDRLNLRKRIAGGMTLLIPLISGATISLSSINFHYLFVIFICFLSLLLFKNTQSFYAELNKRKTLIVSFLLLFVFSFWQFYSVKSQRSLYQVIVEKQKPATFDYMKGYNLKFKSDVGPVALPVQKTVIQDYSEKLSIYMAQGYLGMSIALSEKFETSYGIGHSIFLQRVFDKHLGLNVTERSFQRKINDRWNEHEQWHSAYSHFANDVSFPGVCVVMLLLGFYFSMVVSAAITSNDFIAKLLLPLFGILFLYLPANNQVFSFLETMSSFWILTAVFLYFNKKNRKSV